MLSDDVLVVAPKFISELETLPEATLSKHYSDRDDCTGVYGDPALIEMLRTSIR